MTDDTPAAVFSKDDTKRARLAAILADPVYREATDIVRDQMDPETGTQADVAPAVAAALYHQVAGAGQFRKKLRKLALELKPVKQLSGRRLAKSEDDLPKK